MDFDIVNKAIIFVARRNSGKSVLMKYIVSEFKDKFSCIFCICPTERVNHFYQKDDFVKKENIFDAYKEDWVDKLMKKMETLNEGRPKTNLIQVLVILDDCCSDVKFHHSKSLIQIFTKGRHIGISLIIAAQYPRHIPPVCRQNADFIFAGQLNKQGLETLADEYLNCNLTEKEFIKMYRNSTIDYSFMLINNNSTKTLDTDEVYGKIKAPKNFV